MPHRITHRVPLRIEHRSLRHHEHFHLHPLTIFAAHRARKQVQSRSHASRTTSLAFLSSRKPRKTGARSFPSRVHSANLISQTNTGFSQCILRIMEGVIPCTHCPFCFDGRSTNGQSLRSSARNFLCNTNNHSVVKPVPTLPAKTSLLFS